MLLCRLTERILKIDAPRFAALVRKPARKECALKSPTSSPELADVLLDDQAHGLMVHDRP
jgi:hypothetical protein